MIKSLRFRSSGRAESKLILADAESQARLKIAEAEARALEMIQKSIPNSDTTQYLVALKYIQALPELTKGKNDKLVVVPYESSSLVGSLVPIKKMFENIK